ncbi:MAG: acetyl-CoA carboxylase biotin carboxylase subunit, partial [Deltaproteobacteria bacterium]
PGSSSSDVKELIYAAEGMGFPVIVKAAAGGGGKGMHIVSKPEHLEIAIETARREAQSAFGDDTVFIEKYLDGPRHIEFQVLADHHGKVIHLFERECSIQRRHQKIIEETPSPALTPELREKMGKAAVRAARAVGYTNAGTVEFMMDKHRNFYFLEMNTRLQVEHAITEATTGIDIVKWQIRIAAGEELTLEQKDIIQRGHAIECRVYAEDPERGFLPSTGKFTRVMLPHGVNVRHDTALEEGTEVTPYYDPMVAKVIVHAENRDEAINKMVWALENYVAVGVTTNIDFLKDVLQHPEFRAGNITTHFISDYFSNWGTGEEKLPDEVLIAAAVADYLRPLEERGESLTGIVEEDPHSPWKKGGKWRLG